MKQCRGIALTESLLLLPIVASLLYGVIAGSRLWIQYGALNDVALVSARAAAQGSEAQVQGRLRAHALGLSPWLVIVSTAQTGSQFTATARYPITPGLLARSLVRVGGSPMLSAEAASYAKPSVD